MIGPNNSYKQAGHDTTRVNPFLPAKKEKRGLKLLLWGESGSGKTTLALQSPDPCVLDMEHGTAYYGGGTKFDVLKPRTMKDVRAAVNYLLQGGSAQYGTLIIDPITVVWDILQDEWAKIFQIRNMKSSGHKIDYYVFQPADWKPVKAAWKNFMLDLVALPMNVIVIARQKDKYSEGSLMVKEGIVYDCEKSLEYYFDLVIRMDKKHNCWTEKRRGKEMECIPSNFPASWEPFKRLLEKQEAPEKAPVVPESVDPEIAADILQDEILVALAPHAGLSKTWEESRFASRMRAQASTPAVAKNLIPSAPQNPETLQENFPFTDIDFLHHKVGFKSTGDITWLGLANDTELPNGKRGKQYLHQLADWKDKPDIAHKAKVVLAAIESKGRNHYQSELEEVRP